MRRLRVLPLRERPDAISQSDTPLNTLQKMNLTTKALSIAAAIFYAAIAASCGSKTANTDEASATATPVEQTVAAAVDTVTVLTDDSLLRPGMKVDMLTVVDFNATWCGPCKKLNEPMRKAAAMYAGKVRFYSADVDVLTATDEAFGINKSVPVVTLLLPDGSVKKYATLEPFISSDELKKSDKEQAEQIIFDNLAVIIDENL